MKAASEGPIFAEPVGDGLSGAASQAVLSGK
jgi:hypothetical protein